MDRDHDVILFMLTHVITLMVNVYHVYSIQVYLVPYFGYWN